MADSFSLDSEPVGLADVGGFRTGVAASGMKPEGPDVGVILCEKDGCGTALFSQNASRAAPVVISRPRAAAGRLRAVVVNSGNANCFTGDQGLEDAREMVALVASGLELPPEQVLVASTGVAGVPLPMGKIRAGIKDACAETLGEGKGDFASAILTAATPPRTVSASGVVDGKPFRIAGATKGASLVETGMANAFAFVVTDVAVEPGFLCEIVPSVFKRTFARVVLDGESGTNDTFCVMCSGAAGNEPLEDLLTAGAFVDALREVARRLAVDLAFEEDGATRLVGVEVSGAASDEDAELVARAVAESTLVRTAVHAGKPRWERILAAAGRSGARVVESRATVRLAGTILFDRGRPAEDVPSSLARKLASPGASLELDLGMGEGSAEMWTSSVADGDDTALRDLQGEMDSVLAERRELKARAEGAHESSQTAEKRAGDLEAGVKARDEELAEVRAELAEATEKLKDIEWDHARELRDLKKEYEGRLAEGGSAPGSDEAAGRAKEFEAELTKVRSELEEAKSELEAGKPTGGGEGASPDAEKRIKKLEAELGKANDKLAKRAGKILELRSKLSEAGAEAADDDDD